MKFCYLNKRRSLKIKDGLNRTSIRDFSVRLSFENQAWRDATPFLLFVSVEVGNFYGSDEVVSNCLSGQKASIEAYEQTTFGVVGYTFIKRSACYVISLKIQIFTSRFWEVKNFFANFLLCDTLTILYH